MKVFAPLLLLFILLEIACSSSPKKELKLQSTVLSTGAIHPDFKGIWRSLGEGYIWDASGDTIKLYSYTKNFCNRELQGAWENWMNSSSKFVQKTEDSLSLFYMDLGPHTEGYQSRRDVVRIDKLPDHCQSIETMEKENPTQLFQRFLETCKENYAFSKERGMDWKAIEQEYQSKITANTTEEELFSYFGAIIKQSKDHHSKVIAKDGRRIQYTFVPSSRLVQNAFEAQSEIADLNDYFGRFFSTLRKNITDSLLMGKGQKMLNDQLEWGSLNDSIGYLAIHTFANFSKERMSRKQQLDSLEAAMNTIIKAFKDKKALLLDVSYNFGGFDAAAFIIASYFTNQKRLVYTRQSFHQGALYNEMPTYIYPSNSTLFTKPVYLLISDVTRSAAEIFALQMRAIPSVQLVGDTTLGIQSGMLNKAIGSFNITLSNQRNLSPDHQIFEAVGIPPAISLPLLSEEHVMNGHLVAVRNLVELINSLEF